MDVVLRIDLGMKKESGVINLFFESMVVRAYLLTPSILFHVEADM